MSVVKTIRPGFDIGELAYHGVRNGKNGGEKLR
jgi:hypothetical protein